VRTRGEATGKPVHNMKTITYRPIGILRTPFTTLGNMPIQPAAAEGVTATIELDPDLVAGLRDLDGFSHLILLYHLHEAGDARLNVTPFLDEEPHGVFATRAPTRPNPIGLSVVQLLRIERNVLHVRNVDILDGTPLLDIKPYVPEFDCPPTAEAVRVGWIESRRSRITRAESDDRFT
jgi:tRNA-Thr(GGU) m(6)t(6)A37 methyltransferase TsaA